MVMACQQLGESKLSQSSINPGFHSEFQAIQASWAPWGIWSQSSINPGFHSERKANTSPISFRNACRNPVSILVFIPSSTLKKVVGRNCYLVAIQYQSWFSFRGGTRCQCQRLPFGWIGRNPVSILVFIPSQPDTTTVDSTGILVAIQYQSWFSFRDLVGAGWSPLWPLKVAIQYQSWFSFRGESLDRDYEGSGKSRNPVSILVFIPSSDTRRIDPLCTADGRNPVSILVFIPRRRVPKVLGTVCKPIVAIQYQSWFSFRAAIPSAISPMLVRVAIQYQSWFSFRVYGSALARWYMCNGRNPVSILVFIPRTVFTTPNALVGRGRNPVSILVFIPSTWMWALRTTHSNCRNPVSILVFIPSSSDCIHPIRHPDPSRNPVSILVFIPRWSPGLETGK